MMRNSKPKTLNLKPYVFRGISVVVSVVFSSPLKFKKHKYLCCKKRKAVC